MMYKYSRVTLAIICFLFICGCVERLITITTQPPGARVWLNDQEVGASPVTVPFTWYGQYDVAVRKEGFRPIQTMRAPDVPVYQWPVLDFFAECVLPFEFVDGHHWHFDLSQEEQADPNALVERASNLRRQAATQN
jgi:hypothetical protein